MKVQISREGWGSPDDSRLRLGRSTTFKVELLVFDAPIPASGYSPTYSKGETRGRHPVDRLVLRQKEDVVHVTRVAIPRHTERETFTILIARKSLRIER